MSAVNVVGVVGAGQMGAGIAEVCARAGVSVWLFDVDDGAVNRGLDRLDQSLARAGAAARISAAERAEAFGRITGHRPRRAR
jgi:3-hydroxybutyryl-CoA dehydrogenase